MISPIINFANQSIDYINNSMNHLLKINTNLDRKVSKYLFITKCKTTCKVTLLIAVILSVIAIGVLIFGSMTLACCYAASALSMYFLYRRLKQIISMNCISMED